MPELYFYTTPPTSTVRLTFDTGVAITGVPGTYNGRSDGHKLAVPTGTTVQGSALHVEATGYQSVDYRGIYQPNADPAAPSSFLLDDLHLLPTPQPQPEPEPEPIPPATTPEAIINEVYATGKYNLATHSGCGEFTEACCTELHRRHSTMWGHIRKTEGQNQYDGHAVDALMLLAGEGNGIWDIIHDSVSPSAKPQYVYKGEPDPDLWYYPVPETDFLLRASGRSPRRERRD